MKNLHSKLLATSAFLAVALLPFSFVSALAQDTLANPPASSDPLLQDFLGTPSIDYAESSETYSTVPSKSRTELAGKLPDSTASDEPSRMTTGETEKPQNTENKEPSRQTASPQTLPNRNVQETDAVRPSSFSPTLQEILQRILNLQKKEPNFYLDNAFRIKYITADAEHEGRKGSDIRHSNSYSLPSYKVKDSLNGVGIDVELCLSDNLLLTAEFLALSGKIKSGAVERGDGRPYRYFENSDMKFNDGKLGLRYELAPGKFFNPFTEIGGELFLYEIHYAYTMEWWYWVLSGHVSSTKRHNKPGKYEGDDMAPYAKAGIEMNYEKLTIRLGADYSLSLESAWDGDDDSSLTLFLDGSVYIWNNMLLGAEIAEIPAGNISYIGLHLGWSF